MIRRVLPAPFGDMVFRDAREIYYYYKGARGLDQTEVKVPYWERTESIVHPVVRVGFVGAGEYAQNHLQVLSYLRGAEITSILTTGGPRVKDVAAKYSISKLYSDIDDFLSQDDIDCIVVVVPARLIKSVAMQCLSSGKPVLMEKPPGFSADETSELVDQARKYKTYGMVSMNRRFYSVVEHGLAALAGYGPLRGAILEVPEAITLNRQSYRLPNIEFDHFMFRNSIHGIDLLRYILGDVKKVYSLARSNAQYGNRGASFAALVEHETGALSTILALWDTPPIFRLRLISEQGYLQFGPLEQGVFGKGKNTPEVPIKADKIDIKFRMGVYAQDLHFINAVREGRQPSVPACLLPDAYKTNLLIEQILSSSIEAENSLKQ